MNIYSNTRQRRWHLLSLCLYQLEIKHQIVRGSTKNPACYQDFLECEGLLMVVFSGFRVPGRGWENSQTPRCERSSWSVHFPITSIGSRDFQRELILLSGTMNIRSRGGPPFQWLNLSGREVKVFKSLHHVFITTEFGEPRRYLIWVFVVPAFFNHQVVATRS